MKNFAQTTFRLLTALLLVVCVVSCSTKKNTGWTRFFQSTSTRYNVYFNAEQNYIEQLKQQEEKYEDNFTDLLYISPAQAYNNPKDPQPQGSFERTIEKCQSAIQKHSIKTKPKRTPGKSNDPKYKEFMQREEPPLPLCMWHNTSVGCPRRLPKPAFGKRAVTLLSTGYMRPKMCYIK